MMDSKYMELNMFIQWLIEEGLDKEQLEELHSRAVTRLYEAAKIMEGDSWRPSTVGLQMGLETLTVLIEEICQECEV